MAYTAYLDTVQKLYIAYYQRPADPEGLIYWADRMDKGGAEGMIDAFANSPEAEGLYGNIDKSTIDTVIDSIYQALFNRFADAEGKAYYTDNYIHGTFTTGTICLNILNGATDTTLYKDLTTINNKLAAANLFTKTIDTEFDSPEAQALYVIDGIADTDGRIFLENVTWLPSSIPTQDETAAFIQQNIAVATDPSVTTIIDQTLIGTNDNDTLISGTGNDSLYGGAGSDILDGGEGNDLLYGGTGDDTLSGGTGIDDLYGDEGNDIYIVSDHGTCISDWSGNDTAVIGVDFYKVASTIENIFYKEEIQALPYWIDALLPDAASGMRYTNLLNGDKAMYYCFPETAPAYFSEFDKDGFWPFNNTQKLFAKTALNYISSIVDLTFVETSDPCQQNTINFCNNNQDGSAGYAYYPCIASIGSDIFLNIYTDNLKPLDGNYAAYTLIHELGHALGMKHPFSIPDAVGYQTDPPYLTDTEDSTQWTVMSYDLRSADYHLIYNALDIATLQYLYGPSTTARVGNDTYVLDPDHPNFIWDGGGIDTIDGSGLITPLTLYLEPGYWGYVGIQKSLISGAGQITVNMGSEIENVRGGAAADTIYGNSADNEIYGNAGDDSLWGGAGNDTLDGGSGNDMVNYTGIQSMFTIINEADGSYIVADTSGIEGIDVLYNIERISFSDQVVTLGLPNM